MFFTISSLSINQESVQAAQFTEGDFTYETVSGGVRIISYSGTSEHIVFPSTVTSGSITYDVKEIKEFAFNNNTTIKSVVIPEGVKKIGSAAFKNCTALESVTFPTTLDSISGQAFYGCTSLTSVDLSHTLVTQLYEVFASCKNLETVFLPSNLVTIGPICFQNTGIKSITFPETLKFIDFHAFYSTPLETLTIPPSVEEINRDAFNNCQSLTFVEFQTNEAGDGLITLGNNSFARCSALETVVLPPTIETIGDRAFENCTSLKNINLPNSLISIGEIAFKSTNIGPVLELPEGLTSIGRLIFQDCKALKKVIIPSTLLSLPQLYDSSTCAISTIEVSEANPSLKNDEYGVVYSKDEKTLVVCPLKIEETEYNIPDGVEVISEYAFYACKGLKSITLPNSLKTIHAYAFYACEELTSLHIPDSVTEIGERAFAYNKKVTNLYISEGISDIPVGAFLENQSVKELNIPDSVETIGEAAFNVMRNNLTYVSIPASVISVQNAFRTMNKVTTVRITQKTTVFGDNVFGSTPSSGTLKILGYENSRAEAYVNEMIASGTKTNITFEAIPTVVYDLPDQSGGLVFDPEIQAIIDYTGNPQVIDIPEKIQGVDVLRIEAKAFEKLQNVTSITIPPTVTHIGSYAFSDSASLQSIAIPPQTTRIGKDAFRNVPNVTIFGIGHSAAHDYAIKSNIPFRLEQGLIWDDHFVFNEQNGVVYAEFCIEKLESDTHFPVSQIIAAVYSDNELKSVEISEDINEILDSITGKYEGEGSEDYKYTVSLPLNEISEGDTVKLFFWDNLSSMTPVLSPMVRRYTSIEWEKEIILKEYMNIYDFPEELVSYSVDFDKPFKKENLKVSIDGQITEYQLTDVIEDANQNLQSAVVSFRTALGKGEEKKIILSHDIDYNSANNESRVTFTQDTEHTAVISANMQQVRVPYGVFEPNAPFSSVAAPILQIGGTNGLFGEGSLEGNKMVTYMEAGPLVMGNLFVVYRIKYDFDNGGSYIFDLTVNHNEKYVLVSEQAQSLNKNVFWSSKIVTLLQN
jgi:hypothetical protein